MSTSTFPFSAVVGHDDLRLALLLNAVHPGVGGVLVRGEKGTAKSTAVRALAALLPALDVVVGCQGLRHAAALVLGPPVDLRTVALHHEGEPEPGGRGHRSSSAPARVSRCARRMAPMASTSKARSRAR